MKKHLITLTIFAVILISSFTFISSIEQSFCCEKTTSGAWCQNSLGSNCDESYRKIPASCEATSYCKLGCCYDSDEGTCMENTPEKVCNDNGGLWGNSAKCEIAQCALGCCLIGEQAAFVTQTRCKRLASVYGLEIDFRTDIKNEIQCIASAVSDAKGACVTDTGIERACEFITKKECLAKESTTLTSDDSGGGILGFFEPDETNKTLSTETEITFHEDYLCSSEELKTECGKTKKTTCIEERDEVYFVDSCGNLANIYDASKVEDDAYWSKVVSKSESCNPDSDNANSQSCGNCDYYSGSTCGSYRRGTDKKPSYGDNICRDLSCEYEGKTYQHGETWCADSKGISKNLPGSRYFRLVCYNGEVTVEPCADFRQEICIQSDISGFKTSACRMNMWQDCQAQTKKKNCENIDRRDCKWINTKDEVTNGTIGCVPQYAPGFDFWNPEGEAQSLCSQVSETCIVKYEKKKSGGDWKVIENEECTKSSWMTKKEEICQSLGDCGNTSQKKNYIGMSGW